MNVLWCVTPSTSQLIFPQCPGLLFGVHVIFIHSVLTKGKNCYYEYSYVE